MEFFVQDNGSIGMKAYGYRQTIIGWKTLTLAYFRFNCNHRNPIPLEALSEKSASLTIFTPSMV